MGVTKETWFHMEKVNTKLEDPYGTIIESENGDAIISGKLKKPRKMDKL